MNTDAIMNQQTDFYAYVARRLNVSRVDAKRLVLALKYGGDYSHILEMLEKAQCDERSKDN